MDPHLVSKMLYRIVHNSKKKKNPNKEIFLNKSAFKNQTRFSKQNPNPQSKF